MTARVRRAAGGTALAMFGDENEERADNVPGTRRVFQAQAAAAELLERDPALLARCRSHRLEPDAALGSLKRPPAASST
jgi:hypothetical protein